MSATTEGLVLEGEVLEAAREIAYFAYCEAANLFVTQSSPGMIPANVVIDLAETAEVVDLLGRRGCPDVRRLSADQREWLREAAIDVRQWFLDQMEYVDEPDSPASPAMRAHYELFGAQADLVLAALGGPDGEG